MYLVGSEINVHDFVIKKLRIYIFVVNRYMFNASVCTTVARIAIKVMSRHQENMSV